MGKTASDKKAGTPEAGVREIEERLKRKDITFDALFRLVEKIGTTFDIKKIVRLFLMTLMGQLRLKRVSVFLLAPGRRRLEAYHSLGLGGDASLPSVSVEAAFIRWLKRKDGLSHIDEFYGSGQAGGGGEFLEAITRQEFAYAYPLTDQEELLGALFFGGKVTGEGFSGFDGEILQMLAKVAAMTIRNAWLYQMTVMSKMELEKFTEVKQEFINHTSHELRTPLTVLKSALWSIEPEAVEEGVLIDMAKGAVDRLHGKIEHLLTMNDIQLNRTVFQKFPTDISSLLEDCLREVIPELEEKHVTVRVSDQARFRDAFVDAAKIKIVLRSIIENAVDYVDEGGNIHVTTLVSNEPPGTDEGMELGIWKSSLEDELFGGLEGQDGSPAAADESGVFEARTAASYFVIRIRDDGIGIPEEDVKMLAKPFSRPDQSSTRNVKGLGIGLSVAQKIVTGHGGKLFCSSRAGEGSEFSIWLPIEHESF